MPREKEQSKISAFKPFKTFNSHNSQQIIKKDRLALQILWKFFFAFLDSPVCLLQAKKHKPDRDDHYWTSGILSETYFNPS